MGKVDSSVAHHLLFAECLEYPHIPILCQLKEKIHLLIGTLPRCFAYTNPDPVRRSNLPGMPYKRMRRWFSFLSSYKRTLCAIHKYRKRRKGCRAKNRVWLSLRKSSCCHQRDRPLAGRGNPQWCRRQIILTFVDRHDGLPSVSR